MSSSSGAGTILLARPFPGTWLALACALSGGLTVLLLGLDVRTGVGVLTLVISIVLLMVRFEALIYGIVAATVVLVDGWLMNRSVEDVPFRFGIGRLYLMEIPIYLLFGVFLYRCWVDKKGSGAKPLFIRTPLDRPLLAWLIAFPIFALYGLVQGHPMQDAFGYNEWRCLFIAILFYFLVINLFREHDDFQKLWRWFFLLATSKALYSLLIAITYIDPPLPLVFGQGPIGEGPENVMYLFAIFPALAILLFHTEKEPKWRAFLMLGSLILVANVALSEKRDPQLALVIGLAVLAWHLPRPEKIRWGIRIACLVLLFMISGVLTNRGSGVAGVGASLTRYTEIVDFVQAPGGKTSTGDTFGFHVFDMVDGWEKIRERPIFGQGFGGQTERNLTLLPMAWGGEIDTGVIHNQYLTFWLKMGIAGPILLLWLAWTFISFCQRAVPAAPETYGKAVALGVCAAMWSELAMEFWTSGLIANTKTPLTVFLMLALAVGFLNLEKSVAVRSPVTNPVTRGSPRLA